MNDVPLSGLTTIRLGGVAKEYVRVSSLEELKNALSHAKEKELRVHILGGGSNTIFSDWGFDGLVIHIALRGIEFSQDGMVISAAGEPWDPLVAECVKQGLSGIECLSGIPGLVGATPMQNVGAYGQDVSEVIEYVDALNIETLETERFSADQCEFGYRTSRFKKEDAGVYAITSVIYKLHPNGSPSIRYQQLQDELQHIQSPTLQDVRESVLRLRRKKSMVLDKNDPNTRSCGSFFMNVLLSREEFSALMQRCEKYGESEIPSFPSGKNIKVPAAWLIEHAGFSKGYKEAGVGISTNHTLALININGTSKELLSLARKIEDAVRERYAITLSREPIVIS